tara:strand:- start:108 stop:458 length:351 start_codon:yes stop_codon:yes gene_type:complete
MEIKKLKNFIPELFLISSIIYYWVLSSNLLNPIAIGLLAILIYQIISKKPTLGLIISAVVITLNLFMVLALISELSEFDVVNQNYKNLIIFGSLYLGLNVFLASLMFFKYLKLKIN